MEYFIDRIANSYDVPSVAHTCQKEMNKNNKLNNVNFHFILWFIVKDINRSTEEGNFWV